MKWRLSPRLLATLGFVIAVSPLKNRRATQAKRNDTLYILHDIIQITKSLKTSLSRTHLITDKYLTRNFSYNFWKSRQQHYSIMSSLSVVARIIKSVLPKK